MAITEYHEVALPGKGKIPVRDHELRKGKSFSITGDIVATPVTFDGTGNVELETEISSGSITVDMISDDSMATDVTTAEPTDGRLATAGAVVKEIERIQPLPDDVIDTLFP